MESNTFEQNVVWNIKQIAVQVGHAEKVKTKAKSGYYKVAIILTASIVEALAFKLLSESQKGKEMPFDDWVCLNSSLLSEKYTSKDGLRLSICERKQPRFELRRTTDFKKVNEICFKLGVFSKKFFKKIK